MYITYVPFSPLKYATIFVKSLLDHLRVNIVSEWHGEKSIVVSRGQLCSTFEFPTRAMTLGATARSRLWSRVGSKLMDWSAVHFLVKDRRVELLILRKYDSKIAAPVYISRETLISLCTLSFASLTRISKLT